MFTIFTILGGLILTAISVILNSLSFTIVVAAMMLIGGLMIIKGEDISIGGITAILMYNGLLSSPINNIITMCIDLFKVNVSLERVNKIFTTPVDGTYSFSINYGTYCELPSTDVMIKRFGSEFILNGDENYNDFPNKLYGDELRIRQILINIANNAEKIEDTIIPISKRYTVRFLPLFNNIATEKTTSIAHIPMANAVILTDKALSPSNIPNTAPKDAALETPKVSGEAIGLANNAWYAAPDIARADPISIEAHILGSRKFITTVSALLFHVFSIPPKILSHKIQNTSDTETWLNLPHVNETKNAISNDVIAKHIIKLYFLFSFLIAFNLFI